MTQAADLETLLRQAFAPVEPPDDLAQRMERTLQTLTELAADELDAWELSAMRDPRNWARPAAAAVVGAGAGTVLVIVRARRRRHSRRAESHGFADLAQRTLRDLAVEAQRVFDPDRDKR